MHVVGVGGFGMSAIARVLCELGCQVSGSDLQANAFTRELAALGATIHIGHAAENIRGAEIVLVTSAAQESNPEIAAARAAGIPVRRRREVLGDLMARQAGIAIAGTHGKTTTTALVTHLLREAGLDPTYIVGGVLANTGTNAGLGRGPHFVIEADEYDRMFLGLAPQLAVVTSVEHDHPDCFPTPQDFRAVFAEFAARIRPDGRLIACWDEPGARALGQSVACPVTWYGLAEVPADGWRADAVVPEVSGGMRFSVRRGDQPIGQAHIALAGRHNVQNALAAIAAADWAGVPWAQIAPALESFRGTGRRAEIMGRAGGVTVISDYAHHPTAIRVTLAALREQPGLRTLWAVWQPHTYGRMRLLAEEFAGSFGAADRVLVTEVYSVRETVTPGLDAAGMAALIRAHGHADARYAGDLEQTAAALLSEVQPGDSVVLLSAGDAPQIGARLLAALSARGGESHE